MNSSNRARRAVTDPPPTQLDAVGVYIRAQAINKLTFSQYAALPTCFEATCPRLFFHTLHIEHIQRIMTFECRPVQATSLMAKQWGLKSGSKGGTHKVKGHIRVVGAVTFAKALSTLPETGHRSHAGRCAHAPRASPQNKTLHDGAGTSNDGIGQIQQTYVHTRYSCNFARTI